MTRAVLLLLYDLTLVSLAIEDFKKRKIPNCYPLAILLFALFAAVSGQDLSVAERVFGMLAVSVPMLFLTLLLPGSFGGGDVKLVFACGAFLGWRMTLDGVVLAVFLAGIYAVYLLFTKKAKEFAFGPFLAIGFLVISKNL